MIASEKMVFLICFVLMTSGLLRCNVAEQTDQGMCPYVGDDTGDDSVNEDYEESHFASDSKSKWQSSANERLHSRQPEMEMREEEEFDHPVLGKLRLVTVPIPNSHTGQEFTTGYIVVNDNETSEGSDKLVFDDPSFHRDERPADKYTMPSSRADGARGDFREKPSDSQTLDSLSKSVENSTASGQKSKSDSEMKKGKADDLSPEPEGHCSKDCCTCGDPAVPPPEQKCVRERENCCCGDSATERADLKDGDGDANCSWRCCCC